MRTLKLYTKVKISIQFPLLIVYNRSKTDQHYKKPESVNIFKEI